MSTDGIRCGKNEKLRELFFLLAEAIKEKLIKLHLELNKQIDEEKAEHLLAVTATELFNLVNCRQKDFYGKFDPEN